MTDIATVACLVLLGVAAISWLAGRATLVFTLRVEHGKVLSARGRLSPALLEDLRTVVRRGRCSGRIRVRRERGAAVVEADSGFDAGTVQQLRNLIGNVPLQRLLSAPLLRTPRRR